ncbi:hypothetical protein VNO78_15948 [Psophocarpus tetragonolobus]|uniref:Apple domain-containing protein n=1 Tax=Psophocarpus tetragonolobus TaxID=3891 RepID=A0AAN9SGA6_PSOTE
MVPSALVATGVVSGRHAISSRCLIIVGIPHGWNPCYRRLSLAMIFPGPFVSGFPSVYIIASSQFIKGPETLTSKDGNFTLGSKRKGTKVELTSWKSPSDPSVGSFSFNIVQRINIVEVFIGNGSRPYWRSGPWNGGVFTGIPEMSPYVNGYKGGDDGEGNIDIYYTVPDELRFVIYAFNSQGQLELKWWYEEKKEMIVVWSSRESDCDVYGMCGPFTSCNAESSPICSCLKGFEPRNKEEWNRQNLTGGCARRTPLQCERVKHQNTSTDTKEDGFFKLKIVKVPDFAKGSPVTLDICRRQCLENFSCVAYSHDEGIGCMSSTGNLLDMQQFSCGGLDLYVRVAYTELDKGTKTKKIIAITVIIGIVIIVTCACVNWKTSNHPGRPTMAAVISMLSSEDALPRPSQPAFILQKNMLNLASSEETHRFCSINVVSVTDIHGIIVREPNVPCYNWFLAIGLENRDPALPYAYDYIYIKPQYLSNSYQFGTRVQLETDIQQSRSPHSKSSSSSQLHLRVLIIRLLKLGQLPSTLQTEQISKKLFKKRKSQLNHALSDVGSGQSTLLEAMLSTKGEDSWTVSAAILSPELEVALQDDQFSSPWFLLFFNFNAVQCLDMVLYQHFHFAGKRNYTTATSMQYSAYQEEEDQSNGFNFHYSIVYLRETIEIDLVQLVCSIVTLHKNV